MDFLRLRQALIWITPAATFLLCWAGAISLWGAWGVYLGWIVAAAAAWAANVLASLLWCLIALTALLGWHVHASDKGPAPLAGAPA